MAKSNSPVYTHLPLPLPEPLFMRPYQSGITDPMWPESYPGTLDPKSLEKFLKYQMDKDRLQPFDVAVPPEEELKNRYQFDYAGRVARQDFQSALRVDMHARSREELKKVLKGISEIVIAETNKKPSKKHIR